MSTAAEILRLARELYAARRAWTIDSVHTSEGRPYRSILHAAEDPTCHYAAHGALWVARIHLTGSHVETEEGLQALEEMRDLARERLGQDYMEPLFVYEQKASTKEMLALFDEAIGRAS